MFIRFTVYVTRVSVTFSQDNVIPRMAPVSRAADVMQEDHWASPTMELNDSQGIRRKLCSDSLKMKVKEEHGVENYGLFDRKLVLFCKDLVG